MGGHHSRPCRARRHNRPGRTRRHLRPRRRGAPQLVRTRPGKAGTAGALRWEAAVPCVHHRQLASAAAHQRAAATRAGRWRRSASSPCALCSSRSRAPPQCSPSRRTHVPSSPPAHTGTGASSAGATPYDLSWVSRRSPSSAATCAPYDTAALACWYFPRRGQARSVAAPCLKTQWVCGTLSGSGVTKPIEWAPD